MHKLDGILLAAVSGVFKHVSFNSKKGVITIKIEKANKDIVTNLQAVLAFYEFELDKKRSTGKYYYWKEPENGWVEKFITKKGGDA